MAVITEGDKNAEDLIQKTDELTEFENQIEKHHETLDLIHDAVACEIMKDPTKEEEIKLVFNPRIHRFRAKIRDAVSKLLMSHEIFLAFNNLLKKDFLNKLISFFLAIENIKTAEEWRIGRYKKWTMLQCIGTYAAIFASSASSVSRQEFCW